MNPKQLRSALLAATLLIGAATLPSAIGASETPEGPRVVGEVNPARPFSPAIAAGDFLYLSGAIGLAPEGGVPVDLATESRLTFDYLRSLLQAEGLDFDRVVDAELFLSDSRWFSEVGKIWGDQVVSTPDALPPARATVEAAIALPTARMELAMTAARKGVPLRRIVPPNWPETGKPYSWGVLAADTLFVAGMVANDPATDRWLGGDITQQTTQVMKNIEAVLQAADMSWADVARCRVFLADARDYGAMNEAYGAFVSGDAAPPARSTVQARLMLPEGRVEIQCTAVRDSERKVVLAIGSAPSTRPFSPSILAGGRLFVAGMVGRGLQGFPAGIEAQTRLALQRARDVLESAGTETRLTDWDDVVSVRVFLADIRDYDEMNRVYSEVVGRPAPARATVGTPLASPDALVEIEITAYVPQR